MGDPRATSPILVTGAHRSGTTWVGKMLCLSKEAAYIHEPFTPLRAPGWMPEAFPRWFMYITDDNGAQYREQLERVVRLRYPLSRSLARTRTPRALAQQLQEFPPSVLHRAQGRRALLKDPLALFSAEWLAKTFDMQTVVMIRHPAAFIGSIKKLNWGFDYEREWLGQPLLMRDLLRPFAGDFKDYEGEVDLIGEGIVIWNAIYHAVAELRRRHPDWCFVKYEELPADPITGFRALYEHLGLSFDERVRRGIARSSSPSNPKEVSATRRRAIDRDSQAATRTWVDRLSPAEIARIRDGVADVAALFYDDSEWEPA
jgi:hypothetical protein